MEVGIDVGGTHTRIVVADGARTIDEVKTLTDTWLRGTLFSDPSNADRLLGLVPGDVVGRPDVPIALGVNGCDNRGQCALLTRWVRARHPGPVLVVNDSELFAPATGLSRAISVVCGTGSIVVGRDAAGELVKVGGHGWLLGDPGAAPSLVRESVVAILAAHDRGAQPGPLARRLMAHYGSPDPVQLGYDFTADAGITQWGALAPLVFEAADAGDALAIGVIERDGRQLAADVAELRAKGVETQDVVVAGGVITAQPRLERAFADALAAIDPTLEIHILRDAPVNGALALARALPHESQTPVRTNKKETNMKISTTVKAGLAGVLALLMTTTMTACGGNKSAGGSSSGGPVTLNALFMQQAGYSVDQINEMLAAYHTANPNVTINPTYVAYEALHDKIVTSAPAGTYDIVLTDVIWPAEFASKNILMDVTSRYPASWKDDMLGGAYTTAQYNGKFYGVPWGPSTKFLYVNEDMIAKVGATDADLGTWDGLLAVAKKLKDQGVVQYPLAWSWSQAEAVICDYGQLLGAFGGQFTDSSGKLAVNNAVGVQTMTWMKQTMDDGLTNPASTTFLEDDVQKALAQGQTAFGLNWESTYAALQDPSQSNVVGKIHILPTPAGPNGARPGINGAMALGIPTQSKNADAAWNLITYLTSQPVQNKYPTGWLPNWKSSYTDTAITSQAPELFAAAAVGYSSLILRPTVPNYNAASAGLQAEIQNALLGKKSPQQAMDDAVKAATS